MWPRAAMVRALREKGWRQVEFSVMDDIDMHQELINALKPVAEIKDDGDGNVTVWTRWEGVTLDRPVTSGVSCGRNHKLAERLARAVNAGMVHTDLALETDVDGQSYVQSRSLVFGRSLNADLKRLAF